MQSGSTTGLCACPRASTPQSDRRRWRCDKDTNVVRCEAHTLWRCSLCCVRKLVYWLFGLRLNRSPGKGRISATTHTGVITYWATCKDVTLFVDLLRQFGISTHQLAAMDVFTESEYATPNLSGCSERLVKHIRHLCLPLFWHIHSWQVLVPLK